MKTVAGTMAFITGGASGIGLGMARALAAQGARIAVCDVRADHLAQAAQVAADEGWADRFRALQLDVRDRDAFAAALDEAEAALGPLQILINNAGIGIQGPVDEATYADWDWAIGVNLMGVVNGLVSGLPRIKAHGLGGHIVNTASQGAIMQARATRGVYAPTKAAVISMTEHLKLELDAKGSSMGGSSMGGSSMGGGAIGATVVCPGPVRTNIEETEQHRPAEFQVDTPFRHRDETAPPGALPPTAPGFWLDPLTVGEMTVDAILTGKLYVITHPAFIGSVKARHAGIEAAMAEDYLPR